jgi:Protein of unknown function (DUF2934)
MKSKECLVMARSKSIPGSKSRTKTNNEQAAATPNFPDANRGAGTAREIPAETKAASDAGQGNNASETLPGSAAESKTGPESRKFEVVKPEARKNLLPINLEEEIRRRAYELYEQRGSGAGSEAEDWLAAEREVKQRYRQLSA